MRIGLFNLRAVQVASCVQEILLGTVVSDILIANFGPLQSCDSRGVARGSVWVVHLDQQLACGHFVANMYKNFLDRT